MSGLRFESCMKFRMQRNIETSPKAPGSRPWRSVFIDFDMRGTGGLPEGAESDWLERWRPRSSNIRQNDTLLGAWNVQ